MLEIRVLKFVATNSFEMRAIKLSLSLNVWKSVLRTIASAVSGEKDRRKGRGCQIDKLQLKCDKSSTSKQP